MNIKDRIDKLLSKKKVNLESFFKNSQIKEQDSHWQNYSQLNNVYLQAKELNTKSKVKEKIGELLADGVEITSIEYGRLKLPSYEQPFGNISKETVKTAVKDNVWKIEVQQGKEKLTLCTIGSDLAVFPAENAGEFSQYPQGFQFERANECFRTKYHATRGNWNEAEVTSVTPVYEYDHDKISLIGANVVDGKIYSGAGTSAFKEEKKEFIDADKFKEMQAMYELAKEKQGVTR